MTVAIAVKTSSAIVFAADSKVTTSGVAGVDEDGKIRWSTQTFDHANKIAHDESGSLMVMVVGNPNVGATAITDFVQLHQHTPVDTDAQLQAEVEKLADRMVDERKKFWSTQQGVPEDQWPSSAVLLAAVSPEQRRPRVWRLGLTGAKRELKEIMATGPFVWFEGMMNETNSLMYGCNINIAIELGRQLGHTQDETLAALGKLKILRPLEEISFMDMPTQDAVDLAVFLVDVQIKMDRFTPGIAACGGAIDVMVLTGVPVAKVVSYPGKTLRHPMAR